MRIDAATTAAWLVAAAKADEARLRAEAGMASPKRAPEGLGTVVRRRPSARPPRSFESAFPALVRRLRERERGVAL